MKPRRRHFLPARQPALEALRSLIERVAERVNPAAPLHRAAQGHHRHVRVAHPAIMTRYGLRSVLPFDLDDRAHPGVDAALEVVIAFGESAHLRLAAGSDVGRYQALRSGHQPFVERRIGNLPPAKAPHLSEGMHRSEEHTSELQSRLHLVCRLLLEKKKKQQYT